MSYISELKKFYPNTYKARYAIGAYKQHKYWENEVQRKEDGGTNKVSQSSATASSPRSRRSKPTSSTSKSTRSKGSRLLEIQQLTQSMS